MLVVNRDNQSKRLLTSETVSSQPGPERANTLGAYEVKIMSPAELFEEAGRMELLLWMSPKP